MAGVTPDSMLSHLEANGVLHLTLAQIGDLNDIDHRVKYGDESGWRGDPSMGIFINQFTGEFEVWGIDRGGNEYKACSHHKLDHTILIKLREGDPQRNDVWQKVLDHNAKLDADRKSAAREQLEEVGEKMQWALRRDFAAHMGGTGKKWQRGQGKAMAVPATKGDA